MARKFSRGEIALRFKSVIGDGRAILITSAGMGITAKFAEKGGSDMILISNGSYLRADGHSSVASFMPYGNANDIVSELVGRISPVVDDIPMAAGICGTDPTTDIRSHLEKLKFLGFSAVINTPSVGAIKGELRNELEHAGYGYEKEVDMLRMATDIGFYTIGAAYSKEQAMQLCRADTDAIICDMGFTLGGYSGALESQAVSMENAILTINEMTTAIYERKPDMLLLIHGGPIVTPENAEYIYGHTETVGLLAESAVERIPIEDPLTEAVGQFKGIDISK